MTDTKIIATDIRTPLRKPRRGILPPGMSSNAIFFLIGVSLVVLIGYPTFWIVYSSFQTADGAWTLQNYVRMFTDSELIRPFGNTITIAFGVSIGCTIIALPLAWLTARTDLPFKNTIRLMILASYITPPFLGAVAWQLLASPNSGIINKTVRSIFNLPPDFVLVNIYTMTGIIFVISLYTFPYVFTLITNALDRMPGDLEDASSIAGAGSFTTAYYITMPLALPAVLAGSTIAFLQGMVLFGTPAILGVPAGIFTVTTKIYSFFQFPPQPHLAAVVSLPLLVMTVFLLQSREWLIGRRSYTLIGGKGSAPRPVFLGRWRWPIFTFFFAFLSVTILVPYTTILRAAFSRNLALPFSGDNISLYNFRFIRDLSGASTAVWNTAILAVSVATVATLTVSIIAYVVTRRMVKGYRTLNFLVTAPIAMPGIILGVGLFLAYSQPPILIYGTLFILFLAFLTMELPAGYHQQYSSMQNVHPELEEASRILGASALKSFFDISAPLLRNGVIATWCFVFIGSVRELSAAALLVTSQTRVVSTLMFDLTEAGRYGAISVLGLGMLVVTCIVIFIAFRLGGGMRRYGSTT